jgi:hypothetical protein
MQRLTKNMNKLGVIEVSCFCPVVHIFQFHISTCLFTCSQVFLHTYVLLGNIVSTEEGTRLLADEHD